MEFNLIYFTLSQTLHGSKAGHSKSVYDGVEGNVEAEVKAVALHYVQFVKYIFPRNRTSSDIS